MSQLQVSLLNFKCFSHKIMCRLFEIVCCAQQCKTNNEKFAIVLIIHIYMFENLCIVHN